MLQKDPFDRITVEEIKEHPWINKDRTELKSDNKYINILISFVYRVHKITVTEEDIRSGLHFFTNIQMAKKCGLLWKKNSLMKSSGSIGSRKSMVDVDVSDLQNLIKN